MEKNESQKKRRREKSHIMAKCCRWNQNENCRHCHHHHHLLLSLTLFFSLCDIFCVYFAGVTILVSQTVLSLLIRRVITKTSEAIPLLGSELNSKTKSFPHSHSHESNQIKSNEKKTTKTKPKHSFIQRYTLTFSFVLYTLHINIAKPNKKLFKTHSQRISSSKMCSFVCRYWQQMIFCTWFKAIIK